MKTVVVKRDGSSTWSQRQAAYDKLMPLVWRQLLTQAEHFYSFVNAMATYGAWDMSMTRKSEDLSGWLQLRLDSIHESGDLVFQERFCAMSKNLFFVYKDEEAAVPDEIICLEFATVAANRDWQHAFNISTPVVGLELRAPDDSILEKWTNAIFNLQCSDSFNSLVPQGMRKQHFLTKLMGRKGGDMALRLLKRSNPRTADASLVYLAINDPDDSHQDSKLHQQQEPDGVELSVILRDAKLGDMLRIFAEENGHTADLALFTSVNDILGAESEVLQIDGLPQTDKHQLLRLSNTYLQAGAEDINPVGRDSDSGSEKDLIGANDEASRMQGAYDMASRRLISELLPRFCETEGFQTWLTQQHEEERIELQLISTMQSSSGYKAFLEHVRGQPEEHILGAAVKIEELLGSSNLETPCLNLAQLIIDTYFSQGPKALALTHFKEAQTLVGDVRSWAGDEKNDTLRQPALASFQRVLLIDLRTRLTASFASLKASGSFERVLKEMASGEQTKTSLVHWLHTNASFDTMREFMADRRASESVDFIADVIKFKSLDDVSLTKENANRIHSKFIAEGAVAQICLPRRVVDDVRKGLQPKFPSLMLYDEAVEHTTNFVQQELWEQFKADESYADFAPKFNGQLSFGNSPPILLSIRWVGCSVRHVILLCKRIITIGSSNCDVQTTEAGSIHTTVMQIDLAAGGASAGAFVSMLWNATPRKRDSHSSGLSTASSMSSYERHRSSIIARRKPRLVKTGEVFMIGDYEAMILPFYA